MSVKTSVGYATTMILISFLLLGCFHPPFNNFRKDNRAIKDVSVIGGLTAGVGTVVGAVLGSTGGGAIIGGVVGSSFAVYKNTRQALIKEMQKQNMQVIEYGDTMTIVVPTDQYYVFDTPHLNDICYQGLNNIVKLLKYYPNTPIYVAGFTDDVGDRHHKRMLSQARAETMLTFLWAYDIPAQRLHAEGYADQNDIGNNQFIRGSAYNRRIEIQWFRGRPLPEEVAPMMSATK